MKRVTTVIETIEVTVETQASTRQETPLEYFNRQLSYRNLGDHCRNTGPVMRTDDDGNLLAFVADRIRYTSDNKVFRSSGDAWSAMCFFWNSPWEVLPGEADGTDEWLKERYCCDSVARLYYRTSKGALKTVVYVFNQNEPNVKNYEKYCNRNVQEFVAEGGGK